MNLSKNVFLFKISSGRTKNLHICCHVGQRFENFLRFYSSYFWGIPHHVHCTFACTFGGIPHHIFEVSSSHISGIPHHIYVCFLEHQHLQVQQQVGAVQSIKSQLNWSLCHPDCATQAEMQSITSHHYHSILIKPLICN